jgi:transposase-like protein
MTNPGVHHPPCPQCGLTHILKTTETRVTRMYLCLDCRYIFTVSKTLATPS